MAAVPSPRKPPAPVRLATVAELVLDKGLVIDAHARVALSDTPLVEVDALIAVSSVDTWLRLAGRPARPARPASVRS